MAVLGCTREFRPQQIILMTAHGLQHTLMREQLIVSMSGSFCYFHVKTITWPSEPRRISKINYRHNEGVHSTYGTDCSACYCPLHFVVLYRYASHNDVLVIYAGGPIIIYIYIYIIVYITLYLY
jgi:hypothetical protein